MGDNYMNKKKINPDFKRAPEEAKIFSPSPMDTAAELLTSIRQLEPEDQNEVVKTILKELAIDRTNSVKTYNEARDRASKNMEVFMYNAIGLDKAMAEIAEKVR